MKKTLMLAAIFGCLTQAQAQFRHHNPQDPRIKAYRALVSKILDAQSGATAQKPTGTKHRVIAQTMSEPGATGDSTRFRYSGTRGSRYNYGTGFDGSFLYDDYFEVNYAPMPEVAPSFSNATNMQADSIVSFSGPDLIRINTATYRPDNKITNNLSIAFDAVNGDSYYKIPYAYNTQGHIVTSYEMESSTGTNYDTLTKRTLTYNGAFTQVATDSVFEKNGTAFDLLSITKYYYTSAGKLDSIVMTEDPGTPSSSIQRIFLDYYAGGQLRKFTATLDAALIIIDSVGYTTGIGYPTLDMRKVGIITGVDTNFQFGERLRKYPAASGLPDYVLVDEYAGDTETWEALGKVVYTYTSFSEPDTLSFYNPDNDLVAIARFYYETYEDGVAIKPIAENKDFSIYPNPFQNNIAIDWKGKQQSAVSLRLVNILGQDVYSTTMKLNNGKNTMELQALNSGNYILVIRDAEGKTWSSKVVKK